VNRGEEGTNSDREGSLLIFEPCAVKPERCGRWTGDGTGECRGREDVELLTWLEKLTVLYKAETPDSVYSSDKGL
jgi:hypothetical protein